jgi:hypothetical protein
MLLSPGKPSGERKIEAYTVPREEAMPSIRTSTTPLEELTPLEALAPVSFAVAEYVAVSASSPAKALTNPVLMFTDSSPNHCFVTCYSCGIANRIARGTDAEGVAGQPFEGKVKVYWGQYRRVSLRYGRVTTAPAKSRH